MQQNIAAKIFNNSIHMALLHKSCSPAFPASQLRGIKPLPKNWEAGKAGEQDLCTNAHLRR